MCSQREAEVTGRGGSPYTPGDPRKDLVGGATSGKPFPRRRVCTRPARQSGRSGGKPALGTGPAI